MSISLKAFARQRRCCMVAEAVFVVIVYVVVVGQRRTRDPAKPSTAKTHDECNKHRVPLTATRTQRYAGGSEKKWNDFAIYFFAAAFRRYLGVGGNGVACVCS